jgi:hypothetical protein
MNPRKLQAVDIDDEAEIVDIHPYKTHSSSKLPIVNFDPVQCFLKDLRVSIPKYSQRFNSVELNVYALKKNFDVYLYVYIYITI